MKKTSVCAQIKELLSGQGKAIPLFKVFMPKSVLGVVGEVLECGFIGEGPRAALFEKKLSRWFGNPRVLSMNNGTAALQLALRLAGVGFGDEVISTAMTCVATNTPILAMGAKIIWADIDPATGNIDPADVERKITPKTKAIMAVHWGGYPCDLDELNAIARNHGLKLIEDACHAFGAMYKGKHIGSHSDFSCFSFQAIKQLTTVDGGALTCRTPEDADRGRLLRWYGIDRHQNRKDFRCEEDIREYGYKFHMNDVTAAIGIEQLHYVAGILAKHRAHAAAYTRAFRGLKHVSPLAYRKDRVSAYWLYTLRVKDRDRFMGAMQEKGIVVSQVHARNDTHTMFRPFRAELPGVNTFASEEVCIPVGWWLSERDVSYIIDAICQYDATV